MIAAHKRKLAALLLALAAGAGNAVACQSAQEVMLDPGIVRYAWRAELGPQAGELHQGFESGSWRALGDEVGAACRITGFRARNFQNQERSTPESYRWLVRTGSDTGGPDLSATGRAFRSDALQLGPAIGSGAQAYEVTTLLKTPVQIPCAQFFTIGCELQARSNWPRDGQSVWVASILNEVDDHLANTRASDSAWQRIANSTRATNPRGQLSWRLGFLTRKASLSFANIVARAPTKRFGKGGLFPRAGQGVEARIRANGRAGNIAVLLLAPSFATQALPLPGGSFWLDLPSMLGPIAAGVVSPGRGGADDTATIPVAADLPTSLRGGTFAWQALLVDTTTRAVSLTNAVRMRL